jgi:hypothetical protein
VWEYDFMLLSSQHDLSKVVDFFKDLNRRGRDGWEAIGIAPWQWNAHGHGAAGGLLETYANPTLLVILKRPVGQQP